MPNRFFSNVNKVEKQRAERILDVKKQFAAQFSKVEHGSTELDYDRIKTLQPVYSKAINQAYKKKDPLFELIYDAASVVPQSPTRRHINEFFAICGREPELKFHKPPAFCAPPERKAQQKAETDVDNATYTLSRAIRKKDQTPLIRAQLLERMMTARLCKGGQDSNVLLLDELQLIDAHAEANNLKRCLEVWTHMRSRVGPLNPQLVDEDLALTYAMVALCGHATRLVAAAHNDGMPNEVYTARLFEDEILALRSFFVGTGQYIDPRDDPSQKPYAALEATLRRYDEDDALRLIGSQEILTFRIGDDTTRASCEVMLALIEQLVDLSPPQSRKVIGANTFDTTSPEALQGFLAHCMDTFREDVVGHRSVLEHIGNALLRTAYSDSSHGLSIVLHGPDGVGKKSIAHALARAIGREVIVVPGGALKSASDLKGAARGAPGARPGQATEILLKYPQPSVVVWDHMGHAAPEAQAALADIINPNKNHQFYDAFVGTTPLDLSRQINIVIYSHRDIINDDVLAAGTRAELDRLNDEEKLRVLKLETTRRLKDMNVDGLSLDTTAAALLVKKRAREQGMTLILMDLQSVIDRALAERTSGHDIDAIDAALVMRALDNAKVRIAPKSEPQQPHDVADLLADGARERAADTPVIWRFSLGPSIWEATLQPEGLALQHIQGPNFDMYLEFGAFDAEGRLKLQMFDENLQRVKAGFRALYRPERFYAPNSPMRSKGIKDLLQSESEIYLKMVVRKSNRRNSLVQMITHPQPLLDAQCTKNWGFVLDET